MRSRQVPFNVELLKLTPQRLQDLRPVTSIEFFESANGDLHEEGLFSVPIFGRMGAEERDQRFAYIDIRLEIMHPVIFERLIKLKSLYKGIVDGTQHVLWDENAKDFVAADEVRGHTGYSYFMRYWKQIAFVRNDSAIRDLRIQLIEKYRDRATMSKILVMPAGLRDIETGDDGRVAVADINSLYRSLISISRTIPQTDSVLVDPIHDRARTMLQNTFNEIFKLIEQMLTGKKGFFQSRWASRGVFNSTRNVITAADLSTNYLGGAGAVGYTETVLGMHQASRMLLPIVVNRLNTGFIETVFSHGDNRAQLVDPKSLESEVVEIGSETFDRWRTSEGLEKIIASYGEISLRDRPVEVEGRYLGLIYRGPDKTFRVFQDIRDLPSHLSRKHVYPLTLVELLYLSMYREWGNYYCLTTRYPVTGIGSVFPASIRCRTTVVGEVRRELGQDWEPLDDTYVALEYPILPASSYLDSHVINATRLVGLGGDRLFR